MEIQPGDGMASRGIVLIALIVGLGLTAVAQGSPAHASGGDWEAPAGEAARVSPEARTTASELGGQSVYSTSCTPCHGVKGRGDGPVGALLQPKASDLTAGHVHEQSDGTLFWKISEGRSPMPGFASSLSETQRWQLVHYLRTLASPVAPTNTPHGAQAAPTPMPPVAPAPMAPAPASAQAPGHAVPREDYDALQRRIVQLEAQVAGLLGGTVTSNPGVEAKVEADRTEAHAATEATGVASNEAKPGTTEVVLTGYGFLNYADTQGEPSAFSVGFNPIFLWGLGEDFLVQAELEIETEEGETSVDLEYLTMSYDISDHLTLRGGKYLNPLSQFNENLHPTWINKLPDAPLHASHEGGIVPASSVGVQLRGGASAGISRFGWSAYVANGPMLATEPAGMGGHGALLPGRLDFGDVGGNKAMGLRLEILPSPSFKVALGGIAGEAGPEGTEVWTLLESVDFSFSKNIAALRGRLDARAEMIWSDIGSFPYMLADGTPAGAFKNRQRGGYAQVAFRPASPAALARWELAVRWDFLDMPDDAPVEFGFFDESRWALGLSCWLAPTVAVKAAYEWDDRQGMDMEDQDQFLLQLSYGF